MNWHPECFSLEWESYDIRGRLKADSLAYASTPNGIAEGMLCGNFLAQQVGRYVADLGCDEILYGNQLGTRGKWLPADGPGWSEEEAAAIREFFTQSGAALGSRELMWFDSYNNVQIERRTWSIPSDAYSNFDYLIAAGFCAVTYPGRYLDDLDSKVRLRGRTRVLATLDYVDPWYTYNSMTQFPDESEMLERIAVNRRGDIDGVVFFANDERGRPIPKARVASFAVRFFGSPQVELLHNLIGPHP